MDQAVQHDQPREDGEGDSRYAEPLPLEKPFFILSEIVPTGKLVSRGGTNQEFYSKQQTEQQTEDVHCPDGPMIGCAKGPRAEDDLGANNEP